MRTRLRGKARTVRRSNSPIRGVRVSVIIPVMNERSTLTGVLQEARQLTSPPPEIIVVANGSTDGSDKLAHSLGVRVIYYKEPLGHDVGRSIGAKYASGDILLFLDGDMRIRALELKPYIEAVKKGVDIALNRYSGPTQTKAAHPVVMAKHAFNAAIMRQDLRGASLTAVPHAVSRRALEAIGASALCVPPKAMAAAALRGLRIEAVHHVNVARLNPVRRRGNGGKDPLTELIVGDHIEAIHWYIANTNERGRHSDLGRLRHLAR